MQRKHLVITFIILVNYVLFSASHALNAEEKTGLRFFYHGDGRIVLVNAKNGVKFNGKYRHQDGSYNTNAIISIHRVFGSQFGNPLSEISMRLIEFIDYIEDNMNHGASIRIISGWRSPEYNTKLHQQGRLAATASLHQYGMAADIKMSGVSAKRIWEFVKSTGFGGTGYYHGDNVHVDVGPARFWDQNTSGVGTDIDDYNKRIMLVTDQDIYYPGEKITLRFARMTAFPVSVSAEFQLEKLSGYESIKKAVAFNPEFQTQASAKCKQLTDVKEMTSIKWELPHDITSGRYHIRSMFCNKLWHDMPDEIVTSEFEIYPD
jgi:uncharacterized protein YcbK (DUF882 family)